MAKFVTMEKLTMVANAKSITIPAESETGKLLREIDESPTVFIVNGARYRVLREPAIEGVAKDDLWANYDPQRAIDGMLAAAGSITPEEADRWIEDIYRWRQEGSRPVESS